MPKSNTPSKILKFDKTRVLFKEGTVVRARHRSSACEPDELGIIVRAMMDKHRSHPTYYVIFERLGFEMYSSDSLHNNLQIIPGGRVWQFQNYQFRSLHQLEEDIALGPLIKVFQDASSLYRKYHQSREYTLLDVLDGHAKADVMPLSS